MVWLLPILLHLCHCALEEKQQDLPQQPQVPEFHLLEMSDNPSPLSRFFDENRNQGGCLHIRLGRHSKSSQVGDFKCLNLVINVKDRNIDDVYRMARLVSTLFATDHPLEQVRILVETTQKDEEVHEKKVQDIVGLNAAFYITEKLQRELYVELRMLKYRLLFKTKTMLPPTNIFRFKSDNEILYFPANAQIVEFSMDDGMYELYLEHCLDLEAFKLTMKKECTRKAQISLPRTLLLLDMAGNESMVARILKFWYVRLVALCIDTTFSPSMVNHVQQILSVNEIHLLRLRHRGSSPIKIGSNSPKLNSLRHIRLANSHLFPLNTPISEKITLEALETVKYESSGFNCEFAAAQPYQAEQWKQFFSSPGYETIPQGAIISELAVREENFSDFRSVLDRVTRIDTLKRLSIHFESDSEARIQNLDIVMSQLETLELSQPERHTLVLGISYPLREVLVCGGRIMLTESDFNADLVHLSDCEVDSLEKIAPSQHLELKKVALAQIAPLDGKSREVHPFELDIRLTLRWLDGLKRYPSGRYVDRSVSQIQRIVNGASRMFKSSVPENLQPGKHFLVTTVLKPTEVLLSDRLQIFVNIQCVHWTGDNAQREECINENGVGLVVGSRYGDNGEFAEVFWNGVLNVVQHRPGRRSPIVLQPKPWEFK